MRGFLPRLSLIFALLLGILLPTRAEDNGIVCVMTYNIHHGADGRGFLNLKATAETIRHSGADIIALQEVDRRWGIRSLFRDQAARLAMMLNMQLAFGATRDWRPCSPNRGEFGLAILSRFPITMTDFRLLPGDLEQRGALLAWIGRAGGEFPLACIHLGLSASDRRRQIAEALSWLPDRSDLVLLGDFNARPQAPELTELRQKFTDLQEACGLGQVGTFNYRGDMVRIDYAFAGQGWHPISCRVLTDPASDHYPVLIELLPGPQIVPERPLPEAFPDGTGN